MDSMVTRIMGCLLVLVGIIGCSTVNAVPLSGVHDQGNYTIPIPKGWRVGGSGGHSFYQSDTGGCFNYIDQKDGESLARLCTSEKPWEDVSARAEQAVRQYGEGRRHERRTTSNGAIYHTLSEATGIVFIFLEGRDYFLNIDVEARGKRQQEVAATLLKLLDQVSWRAVPSGQPRLRVDDTLGAGPGMADQKKEHVSEALAMLCEGGSFDINVFEKAVQNKSIDLTGNCPADSRIMPVDNLALVAESDWNRVLILVADNERQLLLNLRLAAIAASLSSDGPLDSILRQLDELASAGAEPVTKNGAIDSRLMNDFLLWGSFTHASAEQTDKSIAVLLKLIDNLAARASNPPDLGYLFWATLLRKDSLHDYPKQAWQLMILDRLHQRFGTIAPTRQENVSPLQYAIDDAPSEVVVPVAQLTRSDGISAGMLSAAIERDRWAMLAALRPIDLGKLSAEDYQTLLVTATNKALESGRFDHLDRLLQARKMATASIDSLLRLVLHAYEKEFTSFGWKTVDYLQLAGASAERVLGAAKGNMDNSCSYMLYQPDRFSGLVERGFDVSKPLPVIGRKDLKVNALLLFLMCRDPRRDAGINEELGETILKHTKPALLNTYNQEIKAFPLTLAAERSVKLAGIMVAAGADPNGQDSYGNTLLMMAAAGNELGVVNFLLSAGADVSRKNSIGINALGYAECYEAEDVRRVLAAVSSVSEGVDVCRKNALKK